MKKGDLVVIHDRSYSRVVRNGTMLNGGECLPYRDGTQFVVIETGCRFPRTSRYPGDNYNDTAIQGINAGEVVFIEESFLRPIKHTITIDDRTVEISHESFLSLKKQLI